MEQKVNPIQSADNDEERMGWDGMKAGEMPYVEQNANVNFKSNLHTVPAFGL